MALIIGTWNWGTKYPNHYVERLAAGVARHLRQDYRFIVFRPTEEDEQLISVPGCFVRLHMFDPTWQMIHGIKIGDRLVCMDLDLVVTGPIDALFDRPDDFIIAGVGNSGNRCPYNGSMWMLRAGYRPDVWSDFSLEKASKLPYHDFPDDQAWFAEKLPNAATWGTRDGVYAFKKPGWPRGTLKPIHAKIVSFPGHRDPSQYERIGWIRQHWIGENQRQRVLQKVFR